MIWEWTIVWVITILVKTDLEVFKRLRPKSGLKFPVYLWRVFWVYLNQGQRSVRFYLPSQLSHNISKPSSTKYQIQIFLPSILIDFLNNNSIDRLFITFRNVKSKSEADWVLYLFDFFDPYRIICRIGSINEKLRYILNICFECEWILSNTIRTDHSLIFSHVYYTEGWVGEPNHVYDGNSYPALRLWTIV